MTWNDTQARLEPQVRCMNACTTTHLNAAHRAQWCAVVTSVCIHGAHAIVRNVLKVVEVVREDVRSFP